MVRFNPPPGWPTPPEGWVPPPGWVAPADWPAPPPDWEWWLADQEPRPYPYTQSYPQLPQPLPLKSVNVWLAVGSGMLALAPFLTWVNVVLLGSLNLFQLFRAGDTTQAWPWLVVVAAVFVGVLAITAAHRARVAGILVGLLVGGLGTLWAIGLVESVNDTHGLASIGAGPFFAVAGAVIMVIFAVRGPGVRGR